MYLWDIYVNQRVTTCILAFSGTMHLKRAVEVTLIGRTSAALYCPVFVLKAANTVISMLINYSLSPFPSDHVPLIGKIACTTKQFFLTVTLTVIFLMCFLWHQMALTFDLD